MRTDKIRKIINKPDSEYFCEQPEMLRSKEFARAYKSLVREQIKPLGLELVSFNPGYCECSGFISDGERFVYFSSGDYRWMDIEGDVLIRTAESARDFRGGMNNRCRIDSIGAKALELLKGGAR